MIHRFFFLALVSVVLLAAPAPARAQDAPSLDRVEELSRLGRAGEAREVLLAWWDAEVRSAPRREVQRGLWLRGRLTVDPAQAALDFQRLVIEYPGGPYSDQALFRLAQAAYASGDSVQAAQHVERLGREYPSSPARREAEAWLTTAGPVPAPLTGEAGDDEGAPDEVAAAEAVAAEPAAADPVPGRTPAVAPTQETVEAGPAEDEPGPGAAGEFAVQLGAFSSRARAQVLLERVAAAGFDGRLVLISGSELVRVRVGTFDSAEGAGAILRRLQDQGFTAALARDAHREERVR